MPDFDNIAEFYELLSDSDARRIRERPLLEDCLRRAPGRRVLDLACGTGFHALLFAESGADVTALDLSPAMIGHASARRPHRHVAYAVGDMRTPPAGQWDIVVCLGNSLSLLPSLDDIEPMFRRVRDALAPGGLFLVQVINYALLQQPRQRIERKSSNGRDVVAVKSLVPHAGRILLSLTFHVGAPEDTWRSTHDAAALLNLSADDIVARARKAGFNNPVAYGSFAREPFDPTVSGDLILLMDK